MQIFVAGGTGAIGRPLVKQLMEGGHDVTVFTRAASRVAALGLPQVRAAVGDAFDGEVLSRAVASARPEVVINQLTNLPQTASPRALLGGFARTGRLRSEASATLVRAARDAGARRVIAQSIAFIYRPGPGVRSEADPLWTEAGGMVGRLATPLAALESATLGAGDPDGVVLRYGMFYGPGTQFDRDGLFSKMIKRRLFPVAGGGPSFFSFVHVDDAARSTVAALAGPPGVFNVVDDVPAPTTEWMPLLAELLGAKRPFSVPKAAVRLSGSYATYLLCHQPGVSNRRARDELGWVPQFPDWHQGFRAALNPG